MRHQKKLKKLGLRKDHRTSLLRNLIGSLVINGRIRTTDSRAKALASRFGHMMNMVQKNNDREAIRGLPTFCNVIPAQKIIVGELKKRYEKRPSGFTRITRIGMRKGDNAKLVLIELL